MKCITARIKPVMLDDVIFALHQVQGFRGAALTEAKAIMPQAHRDGEAESAAFGYPVQARLDLVCEDSQVDALVAVIAAKAHSGKSGDGEITVRPLDALIDIQTGQQHN